MLNTTFFRRTLPAFPDDSDDDDVVMLDSLDQKIRDVRPLFPLLDESEVRKALIDGNGDVEAAINILIDIGWLVAMTSLLDYLSWILELMLYW
ncbi:hypothetical protein DPMN_061529 [Dreissena polymorpha]|uniref:CUE domain-containing protein n=1 Tax=Dreissena polymorpha TaxID=45954 RepID=A0A9D4C810_DREPO|nr:hypothetical protein DPMN_061529 [Dreissena polymorpha]